VEDVKGEVFEIPKKEVEYADDRFRWQVLSSNEVVIHLAGDDVAVGQAALDIVTDALQLIKTIFPNEQSDSIRVYVYPTPGDVRAALRLTGRDWLGAHASPELGVIMVSAANSRTAVIEMGQSVPHELGHLWLYEATGAGYKSAPRWFDEGLATFFETTSNANYEIILQEALDSEATIPFINLCRIFPVDNERALLAYAQSDSLISYIQREFGNQALTKMVNMLADGADCQTMVSRAIGISLEELNRNWLENQMPQPIGKKILQRGGIWILILAAGFTIFIILIVNSPGAAKHEF
jgi:hypothetical protein